MECALRERVIKNVLAIGQPASGRQAAASVARSTGTYGTRLPTAVSPGDGVAIRLKAE
jgi:hypothetical protein